MVYSAIETTCFGLYWPSSGFYNIEEESINAVKTVRGLLIKRSLYQSPDHSAPSARAICKHGEKNYKQRKVLSPVDSVHWSSGFPCGQAHRQDEAYSRFSQMSELHLQMITKRIMKRPYVIHKTYACTSTLDFKWSILQDYETLQSQFPRVHRSK